MLDISNAILNNDVSLVQRLLSTDKALATRSFEEERLFGEKIFHWIYVGDTALHLAAAGYRLEIVRKLIDAGANPNAAFNRRRSTPLHYAADGYLGGSDYSPQHQVATLELLLEAGTAINAQDKNGATALHRATRTRCADAVELLLSAGADTALRNASGSSAFHLAVQTTGRGGSGEPEAKLAQSRIIESYLKHGVSKNLRDGKCQTVLECARSDWVRQMLVR